MADISKFDDIAERQKAEIEELEAVINIYDDGLEKIDKKLELMDALTNIDNLAKEFTEGEK